MYTGYCPAALLLPAALRRYGWLLLSSIGYCWFVILASVLNSTLLPMSEATPAILALATGANLFAWRRRPVGQHGFPFALQDHGLAAAIAVVPFLLGILP